MLAKLLLLFIIVPAIELFLLIEIGRQVGALPTLGLIIFTGALGAFLVKRQGLQILQKIQMEMSDGRLPAEALVDGLIILLAGAFL
ncbi:MAG: FxsA family protein, partial [Anaerolineae bacterium]|nr:FxsA family protein [Anaerolineae bacterium]